MAHDSSCASQNSLHSRCVLVLLSVVVLFAGAIPAQEPKYDETNPDSKLAKERFALMQQRVQGFHVKANEPGFPERFETRHIFRYSDPARQYVDAAIWRLGDKGRPRALVTTELHRRYGGAPRIVYEYLSLTDTPFSIKSDDSAWSPKSGALEWKPIPNCPAPADSAQRRLLQMKEIAKRFSASEEVGKDHKYELRLLPQPVDRYTPTAAGVTDGAIFLFAFGTNPEVVLLIESDGTAWNFAAGRLAGASKIVIAVDNKTVWEVGRVKYGWTESYTASNAPANIPGIAPDGSSAEK